MNRRHFLAASSLTAIALAAEASPLKAEVPKALRVGLIGCGWYGMVNLRNLLMTTKGNSKVEVVSVCDPDQKQVEATITELEKVWKFQAPAKFEDFREMLKPKNLDVVIVGSPDHWHALHTIAAINAGADVYCEKPACHTIGEGIAMLSVATKAQKIVQIGTQRRSTPHVVRAKEFIQSGKIGRVGMVKTCCYYNMRNGSNPKDEAAPATMNWDLWVGPAPMVPYNKVYHPKSWRAFNAFSNGIVGDMFVHMFDTARFILNLGWPKRVSSTGGVYVQKSAKADIPDTQSILAEYDDLTVTWDHRTYGQPDDPKYPWAVFFYGEKGVVKLDVEKWEFIPHFNAGGAKAFTDEADKLPDLSDKDQPPHITPGGLGHMKNFLECVGSRKAPVADMTEGFISTTSSLLGNISMKVNRTLNWDRMKNLIVGDQEAMKLLRRPYREPWVYPEA
ncbi:MAG: Gfo/Idh/MocA family protein [Fimbriiglobus sp.]